MTEQIPADLVALRVIEQDAWSALRMLTKVVEECAPLAASYARRRVAYG